jgi:hypothetical protein
MATLLNLTQDEHDELDNWLTAFLATLAAKEIELTFRSYKTIDSAAQLALREAAAKIGVLGGLATAYVNHLKVHDTTEGMSPLFVNAKSLLTSGVLVGASALGTFMVGAGIAAAVVPGGQLFAPALWIGGGLTLMFLSSMPRIQELLHNLVDQLAEYAIAEFGPIAQDLLLQAEYIWGTEDGNVLIATNPDIIQHLHGIDGENTLIGSAGRNFFYGGPQGDTIITGGGDNVVFGDLMPNFSQLHLMRGGNNVITTGDGDNQIFAYSGNNTITLGDGDNVVYSGLGSDHIHVGAGNNIIDAEAIWVEQVHHPAGASGDKNIVDYSALNRSLVVLASVNEPVTGRRSFTVDKIDPDGEAGTTTDYLQGIQEIRFAPHPNTVMLSGALGRTTAMAFLSDVGPQGTIHTLDLSAVTGNSFAGTGVTVEGGDAFSVGSLSFVGFSRIIGSAYRDDIDLSDTTRNLIIDSGTGGADIATGSGNDIIRMQGEGDVDAGGGSLLSASDGTEFWFIGMTGIDKSSLLFMNYDQVV